VYTVGVKNDPHLLKQRGMAAMILGGVQQVRFSDHAQVVSVAASLTFECRGEGKRTNRVWIYHESAEVTVAVSCPMAIVALRFPFATGSISCIMEASCVLFHAAAVEVSESFETLSLTSAFRSASGVERDSVSKAKSRSVLLHG
jgi:hypothetical protein